MRKRLLLLMIAGMAAACKTNSGVQQSATVDSEHLVNATLWFQNSDEAKVLFLQSYRYAEDLLNENLSRYRGEKKPAVILDIDETVLDNSPYEARLIKNKTFYNSENWAQWVNEARADALPGALEFINKANEMGVEVFYISNRRDNLLQPTIDNLKSEGFPFADKEHVFLKTDVSDKTERRNKVKSAHKVLLLVGDQLSDFSEEYTVGSDTLNQYFIMLPNPMYGNFEDRIYGGDHSLSPEVKAVKRREALRFD